MSRPYDGQRNFLPFGNPFRRILPRGSYRSPKRLALLNTFEQNLAESLKRLMPKDISDVVSLCWMRKAMEFLCETHTNVKTLITDLKFSVSNWDEKWVDIYLDSSVKLLDICIALSSELSRLDQCHLLLQYVLHILDPSTFPSSEQLKQVHASVHDCIQQISSRSSKLENCSAIMQSLAVSLHVAKVKNSAKGKVLMRALYGVKVVTIYTFGVLVAALAGCEKPLMELQVSNKFLWAEAFNNLQANVNREMMNRLSGGKVTALNELEAVRVCVERLHVLTGCVGHKVEAQQKSNGLEEETQPKSNGKEEETQQNSTGEVHTMGGSAGLDEQERRKEFVSDLAGRAESLGNGLDFLSKQVGDFFQIVLTGRDALLSNLREPDVVQEHNVDENKL